MTNFELLESLSAPYKVDLLADGYCCGCPPNMVDVLLRDKVINQYYECPEYRCEECWEGWRSSTIGNGVPHSSNRSTNEECIGSLSTAKFCALWREFCGCPLDVCVDGDHIFCRNINKAYRSCTSAYDGTKEECDKCWENWKNREAVYNGTR